MCLISAIRDRRLVYCLVIVCSLGLNDKRSLWWTHRETATEVRELETTNVRRQPAGHIRIPHSTFLLISSTTEGKEQM